MLALEPIQFWHWWALGGLLMIVEALAPGFMFLWLGVAAALVGLLLLVWPGLEFASQLLAFAVLSVASVIAWRRVQKARPAASDQPALNRRGAQYLGQRSALITPIVNGHGRIRLADGSWAVTGPDLPAGATVEITGVEGTVLRVVPVTADVAGSPGPNPPAPAGETAV
jgi:membrane protein implicated in regulation of membrane protease activity